MSEVLDSLLAMPQVRTVTAADCAAFVGDSGARVLFLTGDLRQRPEGADVAVVVRELLRPLAPAALRLGVVARCDEGALMQRYGVVVLPALVLLRDGKLQDIVARMRDWPVYEQAFGRLLAERPVAA